MAYRTVTSYLIANSLEKRLRRLYGLVLAILIGLGFWWIGRICEELILGQARRAGRANAELAIWDIHAQRLSTMAPLPEDLPRRDLPASLQRWLTEQETITRNSKILEDGMYGRDRDWAIVVDPAERRGYGREYEPPKLERELQLVARLRRLQKEQWDARAAEAKATLPTGAAAPVPRATPVFEEHLDRGERRYYYYQPVYWEARCVSCHEDRAIARRESLGTEFVATRQPIAAETPNAGSTSIAPAAGEHYEESFLDPAKRPFFVLRIAMVDETRAEFDRVVAILIVVAILVVVAAMIALWGVVRWVISKPLNHLRKVSESIAAGDLAIRAEVYSGGEFELLASSFNKMLQNLVDTQTQLRGLNSDLDKKVDELAQLTVRLYEMNRVKSEFLANMSHELRTPLNSILGFSEILEGNEALSDKQRRYVQNIRKSGRSLLAMINEILDLRKLEEGKMEPRPIEFRIDSIVQDQCALVAGQCEDKNIDLVVEMDAELPAMRQDQPKIQQILTNLLSNAIKFTPEGGRIVVAAKRTDDDRLELKVSDTGVGIAESEREIIFEKFRQGTVVLGQDNLTREYAGTGLGLSLVKELCKLLGGDVAVESEIGKGSIFTVTLPWTYETPVVAA